MNFIGKNQSSVLKFIILQVTALLIFSNAFSQVKDISCTITDRSITIRNANTTIRINNDIEFEMFFEKDGVNSRLTKENNTSPSVFLSDSNNKRISFTRKEVQVLEVNDKFETMHPFLKCSGIFVMAMLPAGSKQKVYVSIITK